SNTPYLGAGWCGRATGSAAAGVWPPWRRAGPCPDANVFHGNANRCWRMRTCWLTQKPYVAVCNVPPQYGVSFAVTELRYRLALGELSGQRSRFNPSHDRAEERVHQSVSALQHGRIDLFRIDVANAELSTERGAHEEKKDEKRA